MKKLIFILSFALLGSLAYGQLDTLVTVGEGRHNGGGDSKKEAYEKINNNFDYHDLRIDTLSDASGASYDFIDADDSTATFTIVTADTAIIGVLDVDTIATDAIMYTDTYWDDIRTPSNLSKKVPGKEAKDQAYKGGVVISFEDGADQAVSFNIQLPHGYKLGTDLEFHIHIALPTAGAGAGVENVAFDFTYSWANIHSEFPAETTVSDTTDVQDYAADTHRLIEIGGSLDGSAITGVSSMLICSLTRDVSVGDNYADDVYLIELDFHYQFDAPGSWTEYDK